MADTCITDDHFYFRIEYYNKKGEVTYSTDVNEEIDVYEDHIKYENYCPGVWEDYYDFSYKIEGEKLMVKCINYEYLSYRCKNEKYYKILYKFIKDGVYDDKEMMRYIRDNVSELDKWHNIDFEYKYRRKIKNYVNRFEFKEERHGSDHYTKTAKDWIIKQIKNKNFKHNK